MLSQLQRTSNYSQGQTHPAANHSGSFHLAYMHTQKQLCECWFCGGYFGVARFNAVCERAFTCLCMLVLFYNKQLYQ